MLEHWNLRYIRGMRRQQSMGITNSREQPPIVIRRVINTPLGAHSLLVNQPWKCDTWRWNDKAAAFIINIQTFGETSVTLNPQKGDGLNLNTFQDTFQDPVITILPCMIKCYIHISNFLIHLQNHTLKLLGLQRHLFKVELTWILA